MRIALLCVKLIGVCAAFQHIERKVLGVSGWKLQLDGRDFYSDLEKGDICHTVWRSLYAALNRSIEA